MKTRQILIKKSFTKRQVFDWKKYNALDCELKIFQHVRFWKIVCIKKIRFWFNLLRENERICIFGAFIKRMILNWSFQNALDFDIKVYNAPEMGLKKIHFQSRIERVMFSF